MTSFKPASNTRATLNEARILGIAAEYGGEFGKRLRHSLTTERTRRALFTQTKRVSVHTLRLRSAYHRGRRQVSGWTAKHGFPLDDNLALFLTVDGESGQVRSKRGR